MPKINLNSRDNYLTTKGLVDLHETKIDQYVTVNSDVTFNSVTVTTDMVVTGNLSVEGQTTVINTDILEVEDNIIEINSGEIGSGVTSQYSGIEINRGLLDNYRFVYEEASSTFRIGLIGNLQAITEREDVPLTNGIMTWNPVNKRIDSVNDIIIDTIFSGGSNSTSSSNGSISIVGGLGIRDDISMDGILKLKGITYENYIRSNPSNNDLIINSARDINLTFPTSRYLTIPQNSFVSFGGITQTITSDGSDLSLTASSKIKLFPGTSQSVAIPTNSPLTFGNTSHSIVFNGSNLSINATSNILFPSGILSIQDTTTSSSNSVGSVVLQGGLSIANTTDSIGITNGGAFTVAGGASIEKTVRIGTNLFVEQVANLNTTNIDTTNGSFNVSGTDNISMIVDNFVTINSSSSTSSIRGNNGVIINSTAGSITLSGETNSSWVTSNGSLSLQSNGLILDATSSAVSIETDSNITLQTGTGGLFLNSTDFVDIAGTVQGVPVYIGNTVSETIIRDNLTIIGNLSVTGETVSIGVESISVKDNSIIVNSSPNGTSDGGLLVRRYQTSNDSGIIGDVMQDSPIETSSFQAGSSIPGTIVLNSSSNISNGYYNGWWIHITTGVGAGQIRRIKEYDGTSKVASLYISGDLDQSSLDLTTAPLISDTYELFDFSFAGLFYDELNSTWVLSSVSQDTSSGTITKKNYLGLHLDSFICDNTSYFGGISNFDNIVSIDKTSSEAFLIKKDTDGGDIFKVDTINNQISIINPENNINSSTSILLQQYDNTNSYTTYSQIKNILKSNIPGSLEGVLEFNIVKNNSLVTYLSLDSENEKIFTDSSVDLHITNTGANALQIDGSINVTNSTNSSSSVNGGSITTLGGLGVNKDVYIGGSLYLSGGITGGSSIPSLTTNTLVNTSFVSSFNVKLLANGDDRTLKCIFRSIPDVIGGVTSFRFPLPDRINNFSSHYQVISSIMGSHDEVDFFSIENITCRSITGTTDVLISFTSGSASVHTLQILIEYFL